MTRIAPTTTTAAPIRGTRTKTRRPASASESGTVVGSSVADAVVGTAEIEAPATVEARGEVAAVAASGAALSGAALSTAASSVDAIR